MQDHTDLCLLIMPLDDMTIILAATGSVRQIFAYWRCGLQVSPRAFGSQRYPCAAGVAEFVAASFTKDVIAQAKHSLISTFKLFEGPKAASQKKEIVLDVLGMSGTLEVANPLFQHEILFGARMRAEALRRVDGVRLLLHVDSMVQARDVRRRGRWHTVSEARSKLTISTTSGRSSTFDRFCACIDRKNG